MDIVPQLVVNSLIAASVYALVALGFNLVYGVTRFFNLAHGVIVPVGGYITYAAISILHVPEAVSVMVGIFVSGCMGYAMYRILYAPLKRKNASNTVLLVASLGLLIVIQAGIALFFSSQVKSLMPPTRVLQAYGFYSAFITHTQIIIIASAIVIFFLLWYVIRATSFGKAVRAISDDEEVARIVGINTEHVIGVTFFVGSAIAGLSGILVGYDTGIQPTMGFSLLLKGVVAGIIGGVGTIQGAILGALLLGFIENIGIWHISGEWKDAIAFSLLILFLLFRPQGIVAS